MIELERDRYELLEVRERNTNFPAQFIAFCDNNVASAGDLAIINEESFDVIGVANDTPAAAVTLMFNTDNIMCVSAIYNRKWIRIAKENNHENN